MWHHCSMLATHAGAPMLHMLPECFPLLDPHQVRVFMQCTGHLMVASGLCIVSAVLLKRRRASRKQPEAAQTEQLLRGAAQPPDARPYDVFLSHRGPDVKRNLCAFLEEALNRAGVRTFVDQSDLKLGDPAWDTMQHALQTAELVMPIFSNGYVGSSYCLDELELMMRKPAKVVPIYYDKWPGMAKLEQDVHRCAFTLHWTLHSTFYRKSNFKSDQLFQNYVPTAAHAPAQEARRQKGEACRMD